MCCSQYIRMFLCAMAISFTSFSALADITPPGQQACEGFDCDNLPTDICTAGGFSVELVSYTPAAPSNSGTATYVYEICSPVAGVCSLDPGKTCLDNGQCAQHGAGVCSRECGVDSFHGLSHFDVVFPELGGAESCLTENTDVTGACACSVNTSGECTTGSFVLGDGSCFEGGVSNSFVAKCDETNMKPGDCIQMTVEIAGETSGLGLGTTIVVDKAATSCPANCLAGPSCEPCENGNGGHACLTRTIGFWGNHPWITNDYDPVTVCGHSVGCDGPLSTTGACLAGTCDSITEALCSSPGQEYNKNPAYVTLIRQLTAAKLNLNATAALGQGATCADFEYQGKSIQEWIAMCDSSTVCDANKSAISNSGCIEALDAFNNSQDTGFDVTPAPFDRPSLDDQQNVSGADSSQCHIAKGTGQDAKVVIGKKTKDLDCTPLVAP